MKKLNLYFVSFSGWMGKRGVVPLLRSSDLRFFPIFLYLWARRVLVTRVRETISTLLNHDISAISRQSFLSFFTLDVKILCLVLLIVAPHTLSAKESNNKTYFLSVGEHLELTLPEVDKFTVTNGKVLGHKYIKKRNFMLLKGKKSGFSELVVWPEEGKTKQIYQIYTFSKNRSRKILHLAKSYRRLGLDVTPFDSFLIVEGKIKSLSQYRLVHQLKKYHPKLVKLHTQLSPATTHLLVEKVYSRFFDQYVDETHCWAESGRLFCEYPEEEKLSSADKSYLTDHLQVKLLASSAPTKRDRNVRVKLKVLQEEKVNGEELSLGLDRLEANPVEIFTKGLTNLVEKNSLILKKHSLHISTLAEPESLVKMGETTVLRVGSEVPYVSYTEEGHPRTQWKFAGLKISLTPVYQRGKIEVTYKTEFTRPGGGQSGSVSGNRESSTLFVRKGEPLRLFQILFRATGKSKQGIPYLSEIPILGKIFRGYDGQRTYKRIRGYLHLTDAQ